MIIIFGSRRSVLNVGMLTLVCQNCHNPAAHALRRTVTKFTLFFVPLFPIGPSLYFTQCTFCGTTGRLTKPQALQLVAQQQQLSQPQFNVVPAAGQQQYLPQQQYGQQPALPPGNQPPYGSGQPALPPAPQQQYQQPYQQQPPFQQQPPYQG